MAQYTKVGAVVSASRAAAATPGGPAIEARVELEGLAGVDVARRVAPRLFAHLPGGVRSRCPGRRCAPASRCASGSMSPTAAAA